MYTLKRGFILLVATLFLAVPIIGAQAANTIASSKSNSSERGSSSTSSTGISSPSDTTTVNNSKSNTYRGKGQDPTTNNSIQLNSSRSN
jgi:hypothetical protein